MVIKYADNQVVLASSDKDLYKMMNRIVVIGKKFGTSTKVVEMCIRDSVQTDYNRSLYFLWSGTNNQNILILLFYK